ncbi:MAG: hypothetical protein AAF613_03505 [Pseudomonadota bacterium]
MRWSGAAIAAATATLVGLYPAPSAMPGEDGCSLSDVMVWQSQINDPQEEATPDYLRRVSEAFVRECPERPEVTHAHKIAGLAANTLGDTRAAITHFEGAGWARDMTANFAYAAALLAEGEAERAWQVRDDIVAAWRAKIERSAEVDLSIHELEAGKVLRLTFAGAGGAPQTSWTAIPDGPGWPATLSAGKDRALTAFRNMRDAGRAPDLRVIDFYRCGGRRILARLDQPVDMAELDRAALTAMAAYLARPDETVANSTEDRLSMCLWPQRLLPSP